MPDRFNQPYTTYPYYQYPYSNPNLKKETLTIIEPYVQYGLKEAQRTSYAHAMREVAAIAYLIGRGFNPQMAYQTVESWEINERF